MKNENYLRAILLHALAYSGDLLKADSDDQQQKHNNDQSNYQFLQDYKFHEEPIIKKYISDYKTIKKGKSKKGKRKQAMICSKVESWLKEEKIKPEHLKD